MAIEYQTSIFDMMDEPQLDELGISVCHGSGYSGSRVRIYAAALNLSVQELGDFLKNEYGTGGCSMPYGFMDYGPFGMWMRKSRGYKGDWCERKLSWIQVARWVRHYIAIDVYLKRDEKAKIEAIRARYDGDLPIPYPRCVYN